MSKLDLSLYESSAVIKHLDMLQDIIKRMAGNSADCKKWAVGLVSAIMILVVREGRPEFAWVAFLPTLMLCFLDVYYLALEQQFRNEYKRFIESLHIGSLVVEEVYDISSDGKLPSAFLEKLVSWSVWPFYVVLLLVVIFAMEVVLSASANVG